MRGCVLIGCGCCRLGRGFVECGRGFGWGRGLTGLFYSMEAGLVGKGAWPKVFA